MSKVAGEFLRFVPDSVCGLVVCRTQAQVVYEMRGACEFFESKGLEPRVFHSRRSLAVGGSELRFCTIGHEQDCYRYAGCQFSMIYDLIGLERFQFEYMRRLLRSCRGSKETTWVYGQFDDVGARRRYMEAHDEGSV